MMEHMQAGMPLLKKIAQVVDKSSSTFLGSYLPLRTGTEDIY